jgi:hypothetical protein
MDCKTVSTRAEGDLLNLYMKKADRPAQFCSQIQQALLLQCKPMAHTFTLCASSVYSLFAE